MFLLVVCNAKLFALFLIFFSFFFFFLSACLLCLLTDNQCRAGALKRTNKEVLIFFFIDTPFCFLFLFCFVFLKRKSLSKNRKFYLNLSIYGTSNI